MTKDPVRRVNIAAHLPAMAKQLPHSLAVVFPETRDKDGRVAYTHYTFAQLDRASNRIASGLTAYGITRGMRTVLMVTPGLEFFALTFALFKLGAVPVLIDPGMGLKNLKNCLGEAEPEAFVGITKAHIARIVLGWPKMKRLVTVGKKLWGGVDLKTIESMGSDEFKTADTSAEETAAILFTSGSTGVPKGAVYSHGTFSTQVEMLQEMYAIKPGEIDLATFPLFALFAPALGMTAIVPDMDFTRPANVDPEKVIEAIDNFGVTNMFGSPALLNTVGRYGAARGVKLPSLRRVVSAGAPVQPIIMETFGKMLADGTQIHTPYGATESLPVATIGSDEILGETGAATHQGKGVCVGRPVSAIEVRIIRIDDDPIETYSDDLVVKDGELGEIAVKGPMVTTTYFNRDASTRLAKMCDPKDGQVWHRMGDIGYKDEQGRLWFCGRKTHRVLTQQGTRFTIPVEGVFNAHQSVFRTALVGVTPNESGQRKPVLCVELENDASNTDRKQITKELLELGAAHSHTKEIKTILFHPAFPVDIRHNAKIFRERLTTWAEKLV